MATDRSRTSASGVLRLTPCGTAYLITAILALSISYDLMRTPIQVSDSLKAILEAQQSPSLVATFVAHSPRGPFLRPLREVQIKALLDLADGRYWLAFRGFHALSLMAALFLFTRALRVRTWADFSAAVFALTVLTGMHTFRGTVREAFPINHFLEIVAFCLIAINLAQSRGGWWIDLAAAVTLVVASLTLESGPLVWVVVAAAWACGMRGVSRRGVVAMTMLVGAYLWVRLWYLSIGMPELIGRSSGFLLRMLDPEEIERLFGPDLTWFHAYNVVTSMLSVLFSDPDGGVFETARAWLQGDVPPRLYVAVASSVMTTGFIAWVVVARWRSRAERIFDDRDRLLVIFVAVVIANAAMSYAYTKHEIISVAGAFYGLAAFVAVRHALEYVREPRRGARLAVVLVLAATSAVWAFRSAGVHHMLQVQAFKVRNDWAGMQPDRLDALGYPSDARAGALTVQLRRDALDMRVANPHLLPRWMDRWWGE